MSKADIGLIGLAVMGQNLVLNMNDHGFTVAVFNRTVSKVDEFLAKEAKGTKIIGAHSHRGTGRRAQTPRRVMLMVKAGKPVDEFIEHAAPPARAGRHHHRRRQLELRGHHPPHRLRRVQGAALHRHRRLGRRGGRAQRPVHHARRLARPPGRTSSPSSRPSPPRSSGPTAGEDPCCDWVGENGAGHFVKMVHNGIEYGDMQLICEAYHLMRDGLGMTADEMHEVFAKWNKGKLDSYLIEITRDILAVQGRGRHSRWWTRSWTPPSRRAPASGRASRRWTWASR